MSESHMQTLLQRLRAFPTDNGTSVQATFDLIEAAADEIERLTSDRDLWKERHDRERAAHAKNLTEQQKVEAERDRLRAENADLHSRLREMCEIAFASSPTDVGHDETDVSNADSISPTQEPK